MLLFALAQPVFAQFAHESELGIVVTGGNTEFQVYNGKVTNTYKKDKNTYTLGGHYMYGTSFEVENSRNWDINTKYERKISKKLGGYVGIVYEGDEFAGIRNRLNGDLGAAYHLYDNDKYSLSSELGYRYRREKNVTGTVLNQSQGRLYAIGKKKTSNNWSFQTWMEYLPNFTDSEDWQLNFEPSFNFNFHSNLALKWGYLGKYDNQPVNGNKKFDFTYITSLIAKF